MVPDEGGEPSFAWGFGGQALTRGEPAAAKAMVGRLSRDFESGSWRYNRVE